MSRERWSSWASPCTRSSMRGFCEWMLMEANLGTWQVPVNGTGKAVPLGSRPALEPPAFNRKGRKYAAVRAEAPRIAQGDFRARHFQTCGRLLPRAFRRHPCDVSGDRRGEGAALAERGGQGLGHRRIWHAAEGHGRPHAARGGAG